MACNQEEERNESMNMAKVMVAVNTMIKLETMSNKINPGGLAGILHLS
jgi:hypothetical protein